jgi:hypothetical protein
VEKRSAVVKKRPNPMGAGARRDDSVGMIRF